MFCTQNNVFVVDERSRGGNCLFLRARGWGIDRQVRTKLQIPGGMPGGGWLQVELNHALFIAQSVKRMLSKFA